VVASARVKRHPGRTTIPPRGHIHVDNLPERLCYIKAQDVLTCSKVERQVPRAPWRTAINRTSEGLQHGFWAGGVDQIGWAIA
jgi:hypothetical protein